MIDDDECDEAEGTSLTNDDHMGSRNFKHNASDICVLDCIFNKQVKAYFILDLL